jgi:two-component system, sensor histidine kinase and response regulator
LDWRYLEVFRPLKSVVPYHGTYEQWLVAVSVSIAILAAFVALSISSRMAGAASRRGRYAWASAGAMTMGGGIWAMHFIGMLAFSLPCGIRYDPVGTLLSMIPGILASGVALHIISRVSDPGLRRLIAGAILMGAGIGAMHYSGMAAMRPDALLFYDPELVAVSVIVAVVLAFIGLEVHFQLRRTTSSEMVATPVAAVILGLAVSGMHYTAMQASVFFPGTGIHVAGTELPTTLMAFLIAVISVLIAVIALVASTAGRQWELALGFKAEVARRRILEREAENGRRRLQAIFDAVSDAIVTIDRAGRVQQWSSGAQRIFGYAPDEIVGADITILMPEPYHSADARRGATFFRTLGRETVNQSKNLTAVRKCGTVFPIEISVSEVRDGDELFYTGILRDVTERQRVESELVRAREQAEAANLAKSQFLATMSHEIRTPINGVLGMARLLASSSLNERQGRLIDSVLRSGQALLAIINDVLDFAKIEAGKFELSSVPFDPGEVIAELTDLFSEPCAKKELEFIHFVAEDIPARLIGDPVRLRQILVNLVGNAIKFTERGEILVEVSLLSSEPDAVALQFVVEDTGIGIDRAECSRIFESFHQVDGSMTRTRGGSGLGLAITRQLVELMGGEISVESELGRGSRFTFVARFRPSTRDSDSVARLGQRHLSRSLRVLLVDANAVSSRVISRYLANWQIDAIVASTIEEAETLYCEASAACQSIDVVILDAKGLGPHAIEFARKARGEPRIRSADVILLVGLDSYIAGGSLGTLDTATVLPKPVRPSELFNTLVSIASGKARHQPIAQAARSKAPTVLPTFAVRVLIAEDNAVNQEVATGMLEAMGCRTVSAPNGRAAIRLVAQQAFDVILMDCEMPIIDGIEATRRIREIEAMAPVAADRNSKQQRTPIIALTAHALNEVRDKCISAGMDDFLVKPFDDQQLAETLRRWVAPSRITERGNAEPEAALSPPTEVESARASVIEMPVIESLRALDRNGGTSRLDRAISRFVDVAPSLAATIRETDDAGTLWRAAHSLKSSAGALGATQLSRRCAAIEACARDSGIEAVRPLVATLDDDLTAAIRDLTALTGGMYVPA